MKKISAFAIIASLSFSSALYADDKADQIQIDTAKIKHDSDIILIDKQELDIAKTDSDRAPIMEKLDADQQTLDDDKKALAADKKPAKKKSKAKKTRQPI